MKNTILSVFTGVITIATLTGILQCIFLFLSIVAIVISTYFTIKNKGQKIKNDG